MAVDVPQADDQISTLDLTTGTETRVTNERTLDRVPLWTQDDRYLIYGSTRAGPSSLYRQLSDGTGNAQRLTEAKTTQFPLPCRRTARRCCCMTVEVRRAGISSR